MMYRGHIPKRQEDPKPTKDTAMSCVVAAAFVGGFVTLILYLFYC